MAQSLGSCRTRSVYLIILYWSFPWGKKMLSPTILNGALRVNSEIVFFFVFDCFKSYFI